MKIALLCLLFITLAVPSVRAAAGMDDFYKLGPDSLPQEGVPTGRLVGPVLVPSKVFPGTQHSYWVYIPAQYDPKQPAALTIFNDGSAMRDPNGSIRATHVIDNLTWRREIPVMITVFINPGRTPEQPEPTLKDWGDNDTNRREEYNRPNDKYAQVIVNEIMPGLVKEYNISPDPDMHAIGGASSGGIAAFAVAWERPDEFHKVFTIVGSFVNIAGGMVYPERVLASDHKPIRIFMVDGANDNRGVRAGTYDEKMDWHLQNVRLMEALTKKGYEVNYAWGIGLHGQKQGGASLPEMFRWLWRDYPRAYDAQNLEERSFRGAVTNSATVVAPAN